ncbi:hypothetical protein CANARDRAFT_30723 [[Candida] arabinofermentans NRRL YB-2248]|uniref:SP-RING-type domain-containing protein n=1 Tax=[Candida] arabinofermentans NRRL YB-2248 TaxID=983967 RepID=A0A1E4SSU2_9ASCO|nr:hypothetical protein CANARDRAFT_30723 [[Candida] arabinofermentans NRRL YB-2248]
MVKRTRDVTGEGAPDSPLGNATGEQQAQVSHDEPKVDQASLEDNLPTYYPLGKEAKQSLKSLKILQTAKDHDAHLKWLDKEVKNTLLDYVDNELNTYNALVLRGQMLVDEFDLKRRKIYKEDPIIESVRNIKSSLKSIKVGQDAHSKAFFQMKAEILARQEPELTIEEMSEYKGNESDQQPMYSLFESLLNNERLKTAKTDSKVLDEVLETELFLCIHPTEPLPFTENPNEDDGDDIAVDGGVVNLTCPISRNVITRPMKNLNCGHTYDKDSLANYNSTVCPECGRPLNKRALVEDAVMSLRLKYEKRDQEFVRERKKVIVDTELDKI